MSDVLLIDLSSLLYPIWHTSGTQPDPNWTSTQAVARVRALASGQSHVAVCADNGRSFRRDLDPTYKANRPARDASLMHQMKLTEDALKADGFPVWSASGYEADDVIATAAHLAYAEGQSVRIASSDKDLLQLVMDDANIEVLTLTRGELYHEAEVAAKFGVKPSQMRDWLTLVGDASDNIKGVPGIGAVKATNLLLQFGTLDALIERLHEGAKALSLQPAVYKALTESTDLINRARELVTLHADAPIEFAEIFTERTPAPISEDTMNDDIDDAMPTLTETPEAGTAAESAGAAVPAAPVQPPVTSQALAVVEPYVGAWERQLEPRTLDGARTVAKWLHASRLFSNYGSPEAVFSIILAGRELNLGTMASLRGFHVVQGRVTMAADLMRALVLSSGKAEYFMCSERTADKATWVTKRTTDPSPVTVTFTIDEARKAGLVKAGSGWEKHQAAMVAKTASAILTRLVYADVTFGLYSSEELGGEDL